MKMNIMVQRSQSKIHKLLEILLTQILQNYAYTLVMNPSCWVSITKDYHRDLSTSLIICIIYTYMGICYQFFIIYHNSSLPYPMVINQSCIFFAVNIRDRISVKNLFLHNLYANFGISMAVQILHLNVTIYCARTIHDYSFNETIETND